jgi:branched-chain amino acid transport system ATP-binding protein
MREINTACEELSLGTRRIVEVARALAFGAKVVLLDEPAAGLNGDERDRLARSLRRFRDAKQCAMLVVEHNPEFVVDLSDRILLLDSGKVIEEWVVGSGAMPRQLQRFLDLEDVHGAPVSVLNETLDGL